MIIKKSEMTHKQKSSFKELITYLTKEKADIDIRNAGIFFGTNEYETEDIDLYVKDIMSTQKANISSNDDKTYHLIVSFPQNERPDAGTLRKIEKDIVKSLNFQEHQRISVIHDDTDNFHFHIAINKINPNTLKINTPYRDYKKLGDVAQKIEKKYNLTMTNHAKGIKPYNKNKDIEKSGLLENLESYINKIDLKNINSWSDFHQKLNAAGIVYSKKGAGAVFGTSDNKIFIKASTVNNNFTLKNLENKLGRFIPSEFKKEYIKSTYDKTTKENAELYKRYSVINNARKESIKEARKDINAQYDLKINKSVELFKDLMEVALLAEAGYLEKVIIKKYFYGKIKDKREKFYKEKQNLLKTVYKNKPYKSWQAWLTEEAKTNIIAENYLYKKQEKQNMFLGNFDTNKLEPLIITKSGTKILTKDLRVNRDALLVTSKSKIFKNLLFYQNYFDKPKPLEISGTDVFKNAVIDVIASHQELNISLHDTNLQEKLGTLKKSKEEKANSLLEEFNQSHNKRMYQYLPYEKQETSIYHGFIKHNDQYLILLKSEKDNVFFVKEPVSNDYKIIKENNLKKGDKISFVDVNKRNNFMLDDYIELKDKNRLKYAPLGHQNTNNMTLYGKRYFKNQTILLYKHDNVIYSKIAENRNSQIRPKKMQRD